MKGLVFAASLLCATSGLLAADGAVRILVPIHIPGEVQSRNGAIWMTHLQAHNSGISKMDLYQGHKGCDLPVCVDPNPEEISPGVTVNMNPRLVSDYFREWNLGVLLFSDPNDALTLSSRLSNQFGVDVELPVIRETGFRSVPFTIISVPVQPETVTTLRVYDPDAHLGEPVNVIAKTPEGTTIFSKTFTLEAVGPQGPGVPDPLFPSVIQIDDLSTLVPVGSEVDLQISALTNVRLWAMASVMSEDGRTLRLFTPQ